MMTVGAVGFILLTTSMSHNELKTFDQEVVADVIQYRGNTLTVIMKFVTTIGDIFGYLFLVAIMGLFFYLRKRWRTALEVTLVLVLASGLNIVLKEVISRPRPIINRIVYADFYSFPSGHAMSAIVFYGFISYLSIILIKKGWLKTVIIMGCAFMVMIIGISRIYLGVHFPSDILAGYLAGSSWLMLCIIVLNFMALRKIRLSHQNETYKKET